MDGQKPEACAERRSAAASITPSSTSAACPSVAVTEDHSESTTRRRRVSTMIVSSVAHLEGHLQVATTELRQEGGGVRSNRALFPSNRKHSNVFGVAVVGDTPTRKDDPLRAPYQSDRTPSDRQR